MRAAAEARALQEMRSQSAFADTWPPPTVAERTAAATAAFVAGTVVWARVKGWPAWPALVMTHEDALNVRVPGTAFVAAALLPFSMPRRQCAYSSAMHVWLVHMNETSLARSSCLHDETGVGYSDV